MMYIKLTAQCMSQNVCPKDESLFDVDKEEEHGLRASSGFNSKLLSH
jgi:hypothetical protein